MPTLLAGNWYAVVSWDVQFSDLYHQFETITGVGMNSKFENVAKKSAQHVGTNSTS